MTRSTERAYLKSARQFHSAPVTLTYSLDAPRRYDVALDPWDNPDVARRELDREEARSQRRIH